CGCGNYGNIPLFEYARYCIILGNHFNELCGYGCVYAFYGTDLYNGSDTNTAAISRENYGGADFYCDVRSTNRAGDLWSLIRYFRYAHMGSFNWCRSCSTFDFLIFQKDI